MTISSPANIADPYRDLLTGVSTARRKGIVALLSRGYYAGWRPTRDELARLIASPNNDGIRQQIAVHELRNELRQRGSADDRQHEAR